MSGQSLISQKKKRGPKPTGVGTPVLVRLPPDLLTAIDAYTLDDMPGASRPEVIRAALRDWLIHIGRLKP
jgi:hypothetical protein